MELGMLTVKEGASDTEYWIDNTADPSTGYDPSGHMTLHGLINGKLIIWFLLDNFHFPEL